MPIASGSVNAFVLTKPSRAGVVRRSELVEPVAPNVFLEVHGWAVVFKSLKRTT